MSPFLRKENIADIYPLSPVQEGMLFHSLYAPDSPVYFEQFTIELEGDLDVENLERAWNDVITANPTLRTVFRWNNLDKPVQVVLKEYPISLFVQGLDASTDGTQDSEVENFLKEDRARPFVLDEGPLIRISLRELGNHRYSLVWSFHHIILDGWSLPILINDLIEAYGLRCQGKSFAVTTRHPYRDYIAWLARQDEEAAREFWLEHLRGLDGPTQLPMIRFQDDRDFGDVSEAELVLSESLTSALESVSRRERHTLNALVQTAWAIVLCRLSGQRDVVFGTTLSGRPVDLTGVGEMVGLFINTLPIRLQVHAQTVFSELLDNLQGQLVKLQEFQFSRLSDIQSLSGVRSGTRLFDSIVVFENYPSASIGTSTPNAIQVHRLQYREMTNFPLTIVASTNGGNLILRFLYTHEFIEKEAILRLVGYIQTLLLNIAENPDSCVGDLDMLSPQERRKLLVDWNATKRTYPAVVTVHELFESQVARMSSAVAVSASGISLTFAELNARANQLAHYLRTMGVGSDCIVGLCVERSLEMVVGVLGILKAGGAYLPVDPHFPAEHKRLILNEAGVSVILTQQRFVSDISGVGATTISLDVPSREIDGLSHANLRNDTQPDNLAYVIYTSGSTGRPKGVMVAHHGIYNRLLWMQEAHGLEQTDVVLQKTPLTFDVSVWEMFWPLLIGAKLVIAVPEGHRDTQYLVRLIQQEGVTTVHFVPSMLHIFLQDPMVSHCASLRRVICSGEALGEQLQQDCFAKLGSELHNLYGPTEASIDVTYWPCEPGSQGPVPIGFPIANTSVHILDVDLRLAPVGVPGELFIGGVGLARGYVSRPGMTAERFIPHPYSDEAGARLYKTGDLARYLPDGRIEFLGRIDHQVKVRGYRIELGEVEAVLAGHAAVRECVVVAPVDEQGQRRLVAYYVALEALSTDALRGWLGERLPEYMVPGVYVHLEALPLTPNGKVDRKALPAPDGARPELSDEYVAPRTELEGALAEIWQAVLGVEQVGVHDNFFDLGGDSIMSIQIVSRLNQRELTVEPKQIFQHQSIAQLAQVLKKETEHTEIDQAPVSGAVALTPIQHWFFAQELVDRQHWNHSVLLKSEERIDAEALRVACQALIDHHDALRMSYRQDGEAWLQHNRAIGEEVALEVIDLSQHEESEQLRRLQAEGERLQSTLDLVDGPLLRVGLFDLGGQGDRLLIVIHHVVVDGVSWRILLADLMSAYRQAQSNQAISLPLKSSSYCAWSDRLQEYAHGQALQQEIPYWRELLQSASASVPVDYDKGENSVGSSDTVTFQLSEEGTNDLLTQARKAYRTEPNDLLLTALIRGLQRWGGIGSLLIHLEGHGREEIGSGLDLSRTVGWFTTLFPVCLTLPTGADLGGQIKAIKETLRAVPNKGLGYGLLRYLARVPELQESDEVAVSFNYLGQFDQLTDNGPLQFAHENGGMPIGARNRRAHLLDVNAMVVGGRLTISLGYSCNKHADETIRVLAQCIENELDCVIRHCLNPENAGWTPSDVVGAELTQAELDHLPPGVDDIYGLAPGQHGILFHAVYEPESPVYFEQFTFVLEGKLDLEHFRSAWDYTVAVNPILRTVFRWETVRQPVQLVLSNLKVPLQVHELMGLDPDRKQQTIADFREADCHTPFDLSDGPVMRLNLFRFAEDEYVIVWSHHHVLMDGWCLPILLTGFFEAYRDFRNGKSPELPQRRPYKDYIAWVVNQDRARAISFWERYLHGFENPTPLPVDNHPGRQGGQSENAEFEVDVNPELSEALDRFARQHRITLSTLMQAGWAILLSKYSGEAEVVFGATVSGRPPGLRGSENMVGLLINTLPVRAHFTDGDNVEDLLRTLQEHTLVISQHAHVSLADIQTLTTAGGGTNLFDSILVFENYPPKTIPVDDDNGARIVSWSASEMTNYALTLIAVPGDRLKIHVLYRGDLFTAATMEYLLQHFQNILKCIVEKPQARVSEVQLASEQERGQILSKHSTGRVTSIGACSIQELFEAQVGRTPQAIAVAFEGEQLTYGKLNRRANRLAHGLRKRGVGPDVLVGLFIERSLEMVIAILGVLKAGGAYVPLDPAYPQKRISFMLRDAGVRLLLTQQHLAKAVSADSEVMLCLDGTELGLADEPSYNPVPRTFPENLGYLIYTSGSTGIPKGVAMAQEALLNLVLWHLRDEICSAPRKTLQFASLSFDVSFQEIFTCWCSGGTLELTPEAARQDPVELARLIREQGIERAFLPVVMLKQLAQVIAAEQEFANPVLGQVITAGEQLQVNRAIKAWFRAMADCRLINHYGPSESHVVTSYTLTETPEEWPISPPIGVPIDNTHIYLIDQQGNPAPVGVAGELHIGGLALARGYFGRPGLTAERFIPDPFSSQPGARLYNTGDLARFLPDGNIEFLGRADHQLKIRGYRIEPGEIESALVEHPAIRECVVEAREVNPGDKRLIAYLVPEGEKELDARDIRAFVRGNLPEFMVPAFFEVLQAIPLTPSGKVNRKALPAPPGARPELAANYAVPRNEIERYIAEAFRDTLNVERIGIYDDFFAIGGNSLLAMQVIARLNPALKQDTSVRALFDSPTASALAETVEAGNRPALPAIRIAPDQDYYPVSHAQKRIWFLVELDPQSTVYNMPAAFLVHGPLDVEALRQSVQAVVDRHATLRTTFVTMDDTPMQWIHDEQKIDVPLEDLLHLGPQARQMEARRQALEEATAAFNLEIGPLIRAKLLKLEANEHLLLFSMHHIISDAWSIDVLIHEVGSLYSALTQRGDSASPVLPRLPIQYLDYSLWQNDLLANGLLKAQQDYWLERLAGELPVLNLPADRPRPAVQTFAGATESIHLDQSLCDTLRMHCSENRTTMFMFLLTVYHILLSRLSGQTDVLLGTPIAGRHYRQLEGLIGFFVNTLLLRIDSSDNPSFSELLARVREVTLQAFENQDYPFDLLVEQLNAGRDLSRQALFDTMFVYQNAGSRTTTSSFLDTGFSLESAEIEFCQAKFDLTVGVNDRERGLEIEFEYNTDLFERETIKRWMGYLRNFIISAVNQPHEKVSALPMLDADEFHTIVVEFNRAAQVQVDTDCLQTRFERQAARRPESVAVWSESESITYGDLNARANQLAHYLRAQGVGPDVLVGICLERSVVLVLGILGILKAGGAYVPIDPDYPQERLRFILKDTETLLLLTSTHLRAAIDGYQGQVVCLEEDWPEIATMPLENPCAGVVPSNLAYVIYTSGSTGNPKGALLIHRNVTRLLDVCQDLYAFETSDVWTLFHSFCFDFSVWELFGALTTGGRVVVVPKDITKSPTAFLRLLAERGVTVLNQTPSAFARLLDVAGNLFSQDWGGTLRYIIFGGEALDLASLRPWYAREINKATRLVNMYGITETTIHVTYRALEERDIEETPRKRSVGRPLADLQAYILDRYLNPVPIGVIGELHISGDGLARGYLHRAALTAERFIPNPFSESPGTRLYRTGDLARYLPGKDIEFLGRIDHQVKIRGYRIELGEIEAALNRHVEISTSVVLNIADRGQRDKLVAFYVAEKAIPVSTIRLHSSHILPDYMIPSAFVQLGKLPVTANGKLDRKALMEQIVDLRRPELAVKYAAPSNPTEARLVEIWQEVLVIEQVGVHDDFFDLGGESFAAYRLMARVSAEFDRELPLVALFQAATVEALAKYVQGRVEQDEEKALVLIQPGLSDRLPFFCVHPAGGDVLSFQQLSKQLGEDQSFYGIQSLGRFLDDRYHANLEEMAALYIREMTAVQPQGPYLIGGHSMGGVVAVEIARQLEAFGKGVALLAIFDASIEKKKTSMLDTLLMVSDTFGLEFDREALNQYEGTEMMEQVLKRAKKRFAKVLEIAYEMDILPRGFRTKDAELFVNRIATNIDLIATYEPRPIESKVTMYLATEFMENSRPLNLDAWRSIAKGGMDVVPVPGNHLNLVKMPYVKTLAAHLRATLDDINAGLQARKGALVQKRSGSTGPG